MDWLTILVSAVFIGIIAVIFSLSFVWWVKLLMVVGAYSFIVFFLSRFFVPHMGFRKSPLPKVVSPFLQTKISTIKGSKEHALKIAYDLVTSNFHGESGKTFLHLSQLFWSDDDVAWKKGGYANCHKMNYFLRFFLVKSGVFVDEDIKVVHDILRYNIHQHLKVKIAKRWVVVDPNMAFVPVPFARTVDYWWAKKYDPKKYDGLYVREN